MHSNVPLTLIALAVGYKVFADASKESSPNRRSFGRIVGIFVMTVSFLVCVAPILKAACSSAGMSGCALMPKVCARP